jgi:hypothetical protein
VTTGYLHITVWMDATKTTGSDENHDAGDKTDHHEKAGGQHVADLAWSREAIAPMSIATISRISLAQIR